VNRSNEIHFSENETVVLTTVEPTSAPEDCSDCMDLILPVRMKIISYVAAPIHKCQKTACHALTIIIYTQKCKSAGK
jgi:hypothetical protein